MLHRHEKFQHLQLDIEAWRDLPSMGSAIASIPSTVMNPDTNHARLQRARRSRIREVISCCGLPKRIWMLTDILFSVSGLEKTAAQRLKPSGLGGCVPRTVELQGLISHFLGWSYVSPNTVSVSHLRKDSLSMNCLKSSVSSFSTAVITLCNALSCSIRAFCLSEFCLAF